LGAQCSWTKTGTTDVSLGAYSTGRNKFFAFATMYCPIQYAIDIWELVERTNRNWSVDARRTAPADLLSYEPVLALEP
jgi:hypothetical protein